MIIKYYNNFTCLVISDRTTPGCKERESPRVVGILIDKDFVNKML